VDRPIYPFALEMSKDVVALADPNAHPIRVHLSPPDGQGDTEIVNAKFVVGADGAFPEHYKRKNESDPCFVGAHSWVRKTLGIDLTGEQSGRQLQAYLYAQFFILLFHRQNIFGVSSTWCQRPTSRTFVIDVQSIRTMARA
jgi:hypothetical protein